MEDVKNQPRSDFYRIRVRGRLESGWENWLGGMFITHENDETLIAGPVPDQAALHGLLQRIRDSNLVIISINRMESNGED